jgi:hypothetical protein
MRTEEAGLLAASAGLSGPFGDVVRAVRGFYASTGADTVMAAGVLAAALPGAGSVAEFLRGAVALHRSGATADHGSSHVHRNGFTKVSLVRDQVSGWNLRLHVWWAPARDAQVHDHRWDLASLVLTGSLGAVNYHADDGADYAVARYSDAVAGGGKSVELVGACALRPAASYTLSAGDTHSLRYDVPHLLDHADVSPAATLVLTGPAHRGFSRALVPSRDAVTGTVRPPRMLDRDSAIGEVERFAGYLEEINGRRSHHLG